MKNILSLIFLISIALGCSSPNKKEYKEYEGIWKRIGTIKFENQVAVDTFLFPKDKILFRRKEIKDRYSIWQ